MMTREFSVTCPVLLGCYHSKSSKIQQETSPPTQQTDVNDAQLPIVKESPLGVEVVINADYNEGESGDGRHYGEEGKIIKEEIQVIRAQKLDAIDTINYNVGNTTVKHKDPLSQIPPSLDRKYLDFPFFTDRKTSRHMSKGKSKIMFIMRGLPGSGKSSIVRMLKSVYNDAAVCSADDYFLNEDGEYIFDEKKLGSAHGYSQNKAKTSCQSGVSVVIIDNTNVKRWEMKFYFDTAKLFGYTAVLVEPKTEWKFKAEELALRNSHGVPEEVIRRKVNSFDHVIPFYYGWFLSHKKSDSLKSLSSKIFAQCLDSFPTFQRELLTELGVSNPGRVSPGTAKEILLEYYSEKGKTSPLLHCTSRFCGGGKASGGKRYDSRDDVHASCGQAFRLTLTGLVMTRKTYGVRVTLDEKCLALFERPEESEWKPRNQIDTASIASSSSSLSSSGVHGRTKRKEKKAMSTKKQRKLKKKMSGSGFDSNSNGEVDDDDGGSMKSNNCGAESISKPSLSDLMNARIAGKNNATGSDECENDENTHDNGTLKDHESETYLTNGQIQEAFDSTSGDNNSLSTLYPQLRNSGFARSAHITLKTAKNASSVETNLDVLHACDIENSVFEFNSSNLVSVLKGKAYYFGDAMCCVYFDEPFKMDAIFSGYY